MMKKEHIRISKFLSLVLRHKPQKIGIQLDNEGWADIEELIEKSRREGIKLDRDTLSEVVATNDKKRYSFNEDETKIRANQGHSIEVDLGLEPVTPPPVLYHGTAVRFWDSIQKKGLIKGGRQFVHLSEDMETAVKVGIRHGKPLILIIDSKKMSEQGITFFLSKNGVWLTEFVHIQYITRRLSDNTG